MIIYNITFHIDDSILDDYLLFLKEEYIPQAVSGKILSHPRLCRVLDSSADRASSYALQFYVKNHELLNCWREKAGLVLHQKIVDRYADKVLGFITLLEELDHGNNG